MTEAHSALAASRRAKCVTGASGTDGEGGGGGPTPPAAAAPRVGSPAEVVWLPLRSPTVPTAFMSSITQQIVHSVYTSVERIFIIL